MQKSMFSYDPAHIFLQILPRACVRWLSADAPSQTQGEIKITGILKTKFPGHKDVVVEDVSGINESCGKKTCLWGFKTFSCSTQLSTQFILLINV